MTSMERLAVTLLVGLPICLWLEPPWYASFSIFSLVGMLVRAAEVKS